MTPGRDLRRWPVLLGGGLLNIAIGTYYAWSVFVPPLENEFGWSRTQTSFVATIDMVMLATTFFLAGFILRRVGPRPVAFFGGITFSLGLFLASFTHSLATLYLTWGVMVVNGLAIGIFAAGSGVFGPLAGFLVERLGWRATFQILAGIFFVFTMVGAYLLTDPPEGWEAPPPRPRRAGAPPRKIAGLDVPTSQVVRTPSFYKLWIAYALGTTAGTMVISQLVPFARSSGLSPRNAALAITIGAVGSATGRFFSGWMSDHFGRLFTLRGIIFVSMLATPSLYLLRENIGLFYAFLYV